MNILGTQYKMEKRRSDPKLREIDGYVDTSVKLIVIKDVEPDVMSKGNLKEYTKAVLRHEILHAFLYESGLDGSCNGVDCWATNEEMIDWFAIQSPKIFAAYKEADCL